MWMLSREQTNQLLKINPKWTLKSVLEQIFSANLGNPLTVDPMKYRIVEAALGIGIIVAMVVVHMITPRQACSPSNAIKVLDVFLAIESAAVGVLAGLLDPFR
jgi:hypothetical protein